MRPQYPCFQALKKTGILITNQPEKALNGDFGSCWGTGSMSHFVNNYIRRREDSIVTKCEHKKRTG